jgi:hypothetical protein
VHELEVQDADLAAVDQVQQAIEPGPCGRRLGELDDDVCRSRSPAAVKSSGAPRDCAAVMSFAAGPGR